MQHRGANQNRGTEHSPLQSGNRLFRSSPCSGLLPDSDISVRGILIGQHLFLDERVEKSPDPRTYPYIFLTIEIWNTATCNSKIVQMKKLLLHSTDYEQVLFDQIMDISFIVLKYLKAIELENDFPISFQKLHRGISACLNNFNTDIKLIQFS